MSIDESMHFSYLTTHPATDEQFKLHLTAASVEEIGRARDFLSGRNKTKTAITAIDAEMRRRQKALEKGACRVCGCTEDHACPGGCYWVEPDLCSVCAEKMCCAPVGEPSESANMAGYVDISITDVPKEERACQNCGMLGCCPSMLKDKLTDLRGRKETPGTCSRWRDQKVMNPQRDPLDICAATCSACAGVAYEEQNGQRAKIVCSTLCYDGKRIATTEYAPACLLFDGQPPFRVEREDDGTHAQGGAEAGDEAGTVVERTRLEAAVVEAAMVGAVSGQEAGEGHSDEFQADRREQAPALQDDAVGVPASERLQVLAAEIRVLTKMTVENAIAIGQRLNEAKGMVAHGGWRDWLERNVQYSQDTANRFMRIATEYSNYAAPRNLAPAALYELLALPAGDREAFVSESHDVGGQEKRVEDMTTRELRAAIARRKAREEELEEQLASRRAELIRAAEEKSTALNIQRDKLTQEHGKALKDLTDLHGKVVAQLKEERRILKEELSGLEAQMATIERPDTVTVEVAREVFPLDYDAIKEENADLAKEVSQARERLALAAQVLKRPANMKLMDSRGLGLAVDDFLNTASAFPYCGPVLFGGDQPMKTAVFKIHLDKLNIWLAAAYAALEGRVLEISGEREEVLE